MVEGCLIMQELLMFHGGWRVDWTGGFVTYRASPDAVWLHLAASPLDTKHSTSASHMPLVSEW